MNSSVDPDTASASCGCARVLEWRCDQCLERPGFAACSLRCLRAHGRVVHPAAPTLRQRAFAKEGAHDSAEGSSAAFFPPHRERTTRLLQAVRRGDGLCVLGAGGCEALDLPLLTRTFGPVHLVDADGAALAGAIRRQPASVRRRIAVHGGVDLSGLLDAIEQWDEGLPDDHDLRAQGLASARALARHIGVTFDVVASTCVANQLLQPFVGMLGGPASEWSNLIATMGRTHLIAMGLLARDHGAVVLLNDVVWGPRGPGARPTDTLSLSWEEVPPAVRERLRESTNLLHNPAFWMVLAADAEVADRLGAPRLTKPWLWPLDDVSMLVYALILRRV
jgi:hypothetical protein